MSKVSDSIRKYTHHYCTAVILAAGDSARFGADKLSLSVRGVPVLALALKAFEKSDSIDEIIIVTKSEKIEQMAKLVLDYNISKVTKVVIGGATRTESALTGVCEASKKAKIICVHDGARPFVSESVIYEAIHNAVLYHAAAPAIPVKDTIKLSDVGIVETLPREKLFAVQTPQAFEADIIKAALSFAVSSGNTYTDDCAAAEAIGVKPKLTAGSEDNIKITTPADAALAELIAARLEEAGA